MEFKAQAFKTVMHGRKMIKFDKEGDYETTDKDEIKTIKNATGIKEVKASKD